MCNQDKCKKQKQVNQKKLQAAQSKIDRMSMMLGHYSVLQNHWCVFAGDPNVCTPVATFLNKETANNYLKQNSYLHQETIKVMDWING